MTLNNVKCNQLPSFFILPINMIHLESFFILRVIIINWNMPGRSVFDEIIEDPPIEVFELTRQFKEDKDSNKVNLGVGGKTHLFYWNNKWTFIFLLFLAYKDDNSQHWVLPVVKAVEQQMASDLTLDHEYLPCLGMQDFTSAATRLILGVDSKAIQYNLVSNKWLYPFDYVNLLYF